MARLPYISRDDTSGKSTDIYDHIAETRGSISGKGMPRTFQLLMNNEGSAEALAGLGEHIRLGSSLDPVIRETLILGTARALNAEYEWAHHEPVAREVGVREEVIESIRIGKAPMGLPAKEGVFVQVAKEFVRNGSVGERTFQAVEHLLGPAGTVETILVVGYYTMLHGVLASLVGSDSVDVELDPSLD